MVEEKKKIEEEDEDPTEEEEKKEKLPFANAEIVRLMKGNMTPDKMIKKNVKIAMNKFLGDIAAKVSARMNKYPYVMMEYPMFKEAIRPYENIESWQLEKQRIVKYLDKIKADCDHLINAIEGLE